MNYLRNNFLFIAMTLVVGCSGAGTPAGPVECTEGDQICDPDSPRLIRNCEGGQWLAGVDCAYEKGCYDTSDGAGLCQTPNQCVIECRSDFSVSGRGGFPVNDVARIKHCATTVDAKERFLVYTDDECSQLAQTWCAKRSEELSEARDAGFKTYVIKEAVGMLTWGASCKLELEDTVSWSREIEFDSQTTPGKPPAAACVEGEKKCRAYNDRQVLRTCDAQGQWQEEDCAAEEICWTTSDDAYCGE